MPKQKPVSVYIDDEIALAINRLREEVRLQNEKLGLSGEAPTFGWLTRSLLRDRLGMSCKTDNPHTR